MQKNGQDVFQSAYSSTTPVGSNSSGEANSDPTTTPAFAEETDGDVYSTPTPMGRGYVSTSTADASSPVAGVSGRRREYFDEC